MTPIAGAGVTAQQRRHDHMLVATRTFVAEVDGGREPILKGRTYVVEGHELAQRYPDAFAPAGPRRADRNARGTTTPHQPRDPRTRKPPAKPPSPDMLPAPHGLSGRCLRCEPR